MQRNKKKEKLTRVLVQLEDTYTYRTYVCHRSSFFVNLLPLPAIADYLDHLLKVWHDQIKIYI